MRLRVQSGDVGDGHIVEAAFDYFEVVDSGQVSGITDFNVESLNIFPNPTNGLVNVNFALSSQTDVQLEVTNLLGQTVFSKEWNGIQRSQSVIDLSRFGNGVYIINLRTDSGNVSRRVNVVR